MADNCKKTPVTLEDMLRRTSWAEALSGEDFARARDGIMERLVPDGGYVCRKGEPVDHWHGVIEGLVKMSSDWATGKTASFTGIAAGGWFGEGSMLKTEPRRYDVIALRDSRIACMRRETFHWLLDNSIAFNRFIINQLNERLGLFIGLLESERLLDMDARVARTMAALFHPVLQPGMESRIAISQEEIGYLAGISRQRVNRALRLLEDAGFLTTEYGGITVLDLEGLRRFGG
ncbi:MAG: Crp/Fnr family transcriptional regulator [Rhodocyclales bacterium]|nr:Crp/Fnr family transcriptional regulator [Rhodocyclales bacterium]